MTMGTSNFQPRWACPTGATILDLLAQRGIPQSEFSRLVGLDEYAAAALLEGQAPLSAEVASRLSEALGASIEFWLNRDAQYQQDKALLEKDSWATSFPTKFMLQEGWIRNFDDWIDRIDALYEFFDLDDFREWRTAYLSAFQGTSFRTSNTFETDAATVTAWLRQGERLIERDNLPEWNPKTLYDALPRLKSLTRMKRPEQFLPLVKEMVHKGGVGLALVKAPRGCPVSGATLTLGDGRRLLLLSGRHLSDDHLWFTLFHEIAHLLFHEANTVCEDTEEPQKSEYDPARGHEAEANQWAADFLVDPELLRSLSQGRITRRRILRVAHSAGVSPGIVVGQLQHRDIVSHRQLNTLKRRYQWSSSRLVLRSSL